jgi:hypothetical protein
MRSKLLGSAAAFVLAFGVTVATAQNNVTQQRGDDPSEHAPAGKTPRNESAPPARAQTSEQRGDQDTPQTQETQPDGQNQRGAQAQSGHAVGSSTQDQRQQGPREPAPGQNQQSAQAPERSDSA